MPKNNKKNKVYFPLYHHNWGHEIGVIDSKGKVIEGKECLNPIINQIKRNIATQTAKDIRCVPKIDNVKESDVVTLNKLLGKSKRKGNLNNLRTIHPNNRYKGKVDWSDPKIKNRITEYINAGYSLHQIAAKIGVVPSTLSKANKLHKLYESRDPVSKVA